MPHAKTVLFLLCEILDAGDQVMLVVRNLRRSIVSLTFYCLARRMIDLIHWKKSSFGLFSQTILCVHTCTLFSILNFNSSGWISRYFVGHWLRKNIGGSFRSQTYQPLSRTSTTRWLFCLAWPSSNGRDPLVVWVSNCTYYYYNNNY